MNRKEYSNQTRLQKGLEEIRNDMAPLFKRMFHSVKKNVLSNSKRTATLMFAILLLNIALLFIIISRKNNPAQKSSYSFIFKSFRSFRNNNKSFNPKETDNKFGLSTFFEIKNIRDSLEYIMHKKNQTKEDTLCFIRLYKKFSLIDPSIAEVFASPTPPKEGLRTNPNK
jgi:hypothetical protein